MALIQGQVVQTEKRKVMQMVKKRAILKKSMEENYVTFKCSLISNL